MDPSVLEPPEPLREATAIYVSKGSKPVKPYTYVFADLLAAIFRRSGMRAAGRSKHRYTVYLPVVSCQSDP